MKISKNQVFPLLMEHKKTVVTGAELRVTVAFEKKLSVDVIAQGQHAWLITIIGCYDKEELGIHLPVLMKALMANARNYEDSVALSDNDHLILQHLLPIQDLTEHLMVEALNEHCLFVNYLKSLVQKDETIFRELQGIILP